MLSVVIPCYNEQETITILFQELTEVLDGGWCDNYEILFVDDGSSDHTLAMIKELEGQYGKIRYIALSRNFGKEAAIFAGLSNARGDVIVVMDADLQDPPTLLPKMYRLIMEEDYDSVGARRISRKGEPPIRSFFAHLFYKLINRISDVDIVDGARDYRMMKRPVVNAILALKEYNRFSKGIFGWVGFKTYWISYENVERAAGETKWSFWKLFRYAVEGLVGFSQVPLSMASYGGIVMTFISVLFLMFIVLRRLLFGDPVAGWASTVCIIIFIGGLQLMSVGIIGQYLAKMYLETKQRPHYIIRESNDEEVKWIG